MATYDNYLYLISLVLCTADVISDILLFISWVTTPSKIVLAILLAIAISISNIAAAIAIKVHLSSTIGMLFSLIGFGTQYHIIHNVFIKERKATSAGISTEEISIESTKFFHILQLSELQIESCMSTLLQIGLYFTTFVYFCTENDYKNNNKYKCI